MKYIRLLLFGLCLMPFAARAAGNDFMVAAQLLAAARNADIQQVQILVNNGANVNYVDSTGLSIVCTALMNNDMRAAQILQMYGADASQCDRQIKNYNNRNKPRSNGGLFSGLSSAQSITLAAAGAAVVVGGLFLLTDVFKPRNDNTGAVPTGTRPGGNGGETSTGTLNAAFTLPYGPAMPNATAEAASYGPSLDKFSPADGSILQLNFNLMTNGKSAGDVGQNYLLMMHGYSPLARGYLGMTTLRSPKLNNAPVDLSGNSLGVSQVLGGAPVNVALVTANGINAASKPLEKLSAQQNSLDDVLLLWTTLNDNGTAANGASNRNVSSKYYNSKIILGADMNTLLDDTTAEDSDLLSVLDLSGHQTAINNTAATDLDNLLAKVVGGGLSGYNNADYFGFMPNGQMTIFRTGAGYAFQDKPDDTLNGTFVMAGDALGTGDVLNLFGKNLVVTADGNNFFATEYETLAVSGTITNKSNFTLQNGDVLKVTSVDGKTVSGVVQILDEDDEVTDTVRYTGYIVGNNLYVYQTATADKYNGYIADDGKMYIAQNAGDGVNLAYSFVTADGAHNLTLEQQLLPADYKNYTALLLSAPLAVGAGAYGRSKVGVVANASVIEPLHAFDAKVIDDVISAGADNYRDTFTGFIDKYYNRDTSDDVNDALGVPSVNAVTFFNRVGVKVSPLVIFSTGGYETNSSFSGRTLTATFENAAPLIFENIQHLFMSVVAVGTLGGTNNTKSVSGYSPAGKYALSQWRMPTGMNGDEVEYTYYKARTCGAAGRGDGIDPWCFAAAGVTDELAVASAAGAAGALQSAFGYLNNDQLFALMALTADGPYLASATNGAALNADSLRGYLQGLYVMPNEYNLRWESGREDYLDVFKEVFGYGVINLERATKPTSSVYMYNGKDIVIADGKAYWRAASNTVFSPSSAFAPRAASISAPFYDVLESIDGDMRLPRVWANEFALGGTSRRGLYMGDVLGDLKTRAAVPNKMKIGNLGFEMSVSRRPYYDNTSGLDNLRFDYASGAMNFGAGYQHYFTDGVSRFSGLANPVFAMASNAVVSDAEYNVGRWSVGARMFSGEITDEGLLENDPVISANFNPARLGGIQGAQAGLAWNGTRFSVTSAFGMAHESDTVLGAQTGGLLSLGNGDTTYIDTVMRYNALDNLTLTARATFARTVADASGDFILGISDMHSDAFAFGADWGNFSFTVSRPLAVTRGAMQYAHAEYDIVQNTDGVYDLKVLDTHVANVDVSPAVREMRFTGSYRHKFGEFTDGAVGFIYRQHPNNTDDFGDESIFMLKLTHRLGI